ncbi:hypothetical protein RQP46_001812 [Phenoliferia psychrophenolica]
MERLEARLTQELGTAFTDLRSQLSVALSSIPGSPLDTATRSRHYDLPAPGSFPTPSNFPRPPPSFAPRSVPAPGARFGPRHGGSESDDEDDQNAATRPTGVEEHDTSAPPPRDDELPAYTPRAVPAPTADEVRRIHAYESRSGKLRLQCTAAGQAHILLLQPLEGDGKVWLEGELKLSLPQPESITHIKIRLKGLVRTMVMRIHGSGRHPVTEDVLIWEDAATLWTAPVDEEQARLQGQKIHHPVKRGLFAGKRAWFEVVLLLPTPARFSRCSSVEFAIKIVSSDPGVTSTFPPGCVTVCLIQRCFVSAQGLSGTHDIQVAQTRTLVDGPEEGTWVQNLSDRGLILAPPQTHNIASSFRAPNLVVQFLLSVRVAVPGGGNDAELSWPIEILPSTGLPRPIPTVQPICMGPPSGSSSSSNPPPPDIDLPSSPADPSLRLGLPPSYFAVAANS